jgi:hypothetical protein
MLSSVIVPPFQTLLQTALSANRTDYVEVLLDLNITLSMKQINELYQVIKKLSFIFATWKEDHLASGYQ